MRVHSVLTKAIALFVILSITAALALSSFAVEPEIDWADYDWDNFSIKTVTDEEWYSMCDWFLSDAELSIIFYVSCRTDGFYSEDISWISYERFSQEPTEFIHALSLENAETTELVIGNVLFYGYCGKEEKEECEKILSSLVLPESATEGEREVLRSMIACAKQHYNMQITNPKTADNAHIIAALLGMLACGSGAIFIRKKTI